MEDNADLVANIADFLEAHGHLVDVAQDGVTGLHLAVAPCKSKTKPPSPGAILPTLCTILRYGGFAWEVARCAQRPTSENSAFRLSLEEMKGLPLPICPVQ